MENVASTPNAQQQHAQLQDDMAFLLEKLPDRIAKLLKIMQIIDKGVHDAKQIRPPMRQINKARRRTQKQMKRISHSRMIFNHDLTMLFKRYNALLQRVQALHVHFVQGHIPVPLPSVVVEEGNEIIHDYHSADEIYHKINTEYTALREMISAIGNPRASANNNDSNHNSNNNTPHSPTIRFGEPSIHPIPHREEAYTTYLPDRLAASQGGRYRTRRGSKRDSKRSKRDPKRRRTRRNRA
jgi:hypothetical protein